MVNNGCSTIRQSAIALLVAVVFCLLFCATALAEDSAASSADAAAPTTSATSSSGDATYIPLATDSAGSAFTLEETLNGRFAKGDVYWGGNNLLMRASKVGNDLVAGGNKISLADSAIQSDLRLAAVNIDIANTKVAGNATLLATTIDIGEGARATGYYCLGSDLVFEGTGERYVGYGQNIVFNGTIDGDVTLSAQNIEIGPNAKITGTIFVRSGQVLAIPSTAQVGAVDNTMSQPNTIDQATQLRAKIAPFFQVGSILFIVVAGILMALIALWLFERKLSESNRLVCKRPIPMIAAGLVTVVLLPALAALSIALILTIPLAVVLLLVLAIAAIVCIPFTGASLGLLLADRFNFKRALCAAVCAGVLAALLFVPYLNLAAFLLSMVYLLGYISYSLVLGHDEEHDSAFRRKKLERETEKNV